MAIVFDFVDRAQLIYFFQNQDISLLSSPLLNTYVPHFLRMIFFIGGVCLVNLF